jgi:hypothetical protein
MDGSTPFPLSLAQITACQSHICLTLLFRGGVVLVTVLCVGLVEVLWLGICGDGVAVSDLS